MKKTFAAAVLGFAALSAQGAAAQSCGGIYTVQRGDSLSAISDRLYKNANLWRLVLAQNIASIGERPSNLRIGMRLELPCIEGLPVGLESGTIEGSNIPTAAKNPVPAPAATQAEPKGRRLNVLTSNNFEPFVGKSLHNRGFLVDMVNSALKAKELEEGYAIHWVDDRDAHMEPLLSAALLDVGFPWYKPDCDANPGNASCLNLLFSEPLFETLRLVFSDASNPIDFTKGDDIEGKTFCHVNGYDSALFDAEGRNWLKDEKIEIVYGETPTQCLQMVLDEDADAVVLNEFTGQTALARMDAKDRIAPVPTPIEINAFHMVVHKFHPDAENVLATINDGLKAIHENGQYQAIVEDHMARIWADF